ncbi:kinase-like domain-containing protein [Tanacetum coccineum]
MSFTRPTSTFFTRPPSFGYMDLSINQQIPKDLDRFPLKDIIQATNNFSEENIIEKNSEWIVYNGEFSGKKLAFILVESNNYTMINIRRVVMFSSLPKHQNIVSFIGCCDNYDDKVIFVLEHLTRGGLDKYVSGTHLTWLMRVRICLDIASGLHYLHETHAMKIEDLNSASIHLDENWQAKIQLITPSAFICNTRPRSAIIGDLRVPVTSYRGQVEYVDEGELGYSFGVILFELLCARLAVNDEEGGTQFFSKLARSHYEKGTLTEIVDPLLRAQMNRDSIVIFSEIAYRCLNEDPSLRPTILVVIEELQKVLKLQQGFEISEHQQIMDIGTPCRETISFMYNLVRVSILSVAQATNRVSLDPDTSCKNLGRISNALSIPRKFSALRHLLQHLPFQGGSESHNRNLRAIIANGVVSCSTLSVQEYAEDFYD